MGNVFFLSTMGYVFNNSLIFDKRRIKAFFFVNIKELKLNRPKLMKKAQICKRFPFFFGEKEV